MFKQIVFTTMLASVFVCAPGFAVGKSPEKKKVGQQDIVAKKGQAKFETSTRYLRLSDLNLSWQTIGQQGQKSNTMKWMAVDGSEPSKAQSIAAGWTTIMSEDFEADFPANKWVLGYNGNSSQDGYGYTWGNDDYLPHSGSKSGWCADHNYKGQMDLDPQQDNYPNNLRAAMIYGPFSLSDATDAELLFYFWNRSEINHDALFWIASIDGNSFSATGVTGNSNGWLSMNFDLTNVYQLGNLCGQDQVWIGFLFISDATITDKGAFVDDIVLRKYVGSPEIAVTSPNGGETWNSGTSQNITWTSSGTSGNVKIEYSTNGGSGWSNIISSTADDGSYKWTIPNTPSTNCLVKITDTDGSPSDQSNSAFTIRSEQIAVTAPNGGEIWTVGTSQNITWTSSGTSGNVKIEYSTNGGSSWNFITSTPDDGSHTWTIPNTPSTNCLVKVADVDGSPFDQSNSTFTIRGEQITVTAPNGGEIWYVGTNQKITWASGGATSGNVKIEYSTNGGSTWTTLVASTSDDGSYDWTIPNTPSTNCLVKIADVDGYPSDQSNSTFTIRSEQITVTAPNGGEIWNVGTSQNITWTSSGTSGNMKIEYSTSDGSNWSTIEVSTPDDGSYDWTIPNTPSSNCLVKITDVDGSPSDQSNGAFTIRSEYIAVTAPNGGEIWIAGTSQNIIWTSSGTSGNVKIEYSTNGGSRWFTIVASTLDDGSHAWTIPNTPSANCLVKIADVDGNPTDQSDGAFSIKEDSITPGTQKWAFTTLSYGYGFSSPAIGADGTIYIAQDYVYALNPNGTQKWVFRTGGSLTSPAIGTDGTIYVGSADKKLYALNPNGTQKWAFTAGSYLSSSPAIGADGTIYVGCWDKKLYALNPNGTQKWTFTTGNEVHSSPAIGADGTIYIGSNDHKFYALNPNGTQKWAFSIGNYGGSSPAIGIGGTIYYVGARDDNKLYAINPNGTQRWAFTFGNITGEFVDSSPAIATDGTIYVGSHDKKLYAINSDGTQKWAFTIGDRVESSPAIGDDGTIYVGSWDNKLYALNPDGTQKWAFTAEDNVEFSPTIGADGTIYVGSAHKFYAIYSTSSGLAQSVWPKFRANNQNTGRFSSTETSVQRQSDILPDEFALLPNYPNPFNPETTIRFNLPKSYEIELSIYNVLGGKVRTLAKSKYAAGWHQVHWDGRGDAGTPVGSGIYIVKLRAAGFEMTRKMSLVR